jgi:hypothetical protein
MKSEYGMIHQAGILLQIDCPDLAMSWHMRHCGADNNLCAAANKSERRLERFRRSTSWDAACRSQPVKRALIIIARLQICVTALICDQRQCFGAPTDSEREETL